MTFQSPLPYLSSPVRIPKVPECRPSSDTAEQLSEQIELWKKQKVKCQLNGDYLRAEEALSELDRLSKLLKRKQSAHQQSEQRGRVQKLVDKQRQRMDSFEAEWAARFRKFDSRRRILLHNTQEQHSRALKEYASQLKSLYQSQAAKPSPRILAERDRELALSSQNRFAEARVVQSRRLVLEQQHQCEHREQLQRQLECEVKLKQKQLGRDYAILSDKLSNARSELESDYLRQQSFLAKRQRTQLNSARHCKAESSKVQIQPSMAPRLDSNEHSESNEQTIENKPNHLAAMLRELDSLERDLCLITRDPSTPGPA